MEKSTLLEVFFVLEIIFSPGLCGIIKGVQGQLSPDFYNVTCPGVKTLVRNKMQQHFTTDGTIPAHILRMQFHDCAATGCDASLLLTGANSEQNAQPNLSVLGYDVIDDIKASVETSCPAVVSCADILAMAARDAVFLTQGPDFVVPLGRFDSTFSGGGNVSLPGPDWSVVNTISFFNNIHLNATDLVVLNGAHTIGVAHCNSFVSRLYNYHGTANASDPSIDPTFLQQMEQTCPQGSTNLNNFMALDQFSINTFDNQFFSQMKLHHGVLGLDQALLTSNVTANAMIQMSLNQSLFFESFAASMVKMGQFNTSDRSTGSIRLNCSVLNPPATAPVSPSPPSPPANAPASPPGIPPSPANAPAAASLPGISPSPGAPASLPEIAPSPAGAPASLPEIAPSPLDAMAVSPFDAPADSPGEDLAPVAGG